MYKDSEYDDSFTSFRGWHGHRARRGDMVPIILKLLLEKPMHGYEIISKLEEKSHGMWRPSAGSVYPNLQMLEEKGLVTSRTENDKKVYSLSDKGKEAAEKIDEKFKAHWEDKTHHAKHFKEMKFIFVDTMHILHRIAEQDSEEKNAAVKKILEETRDKLSKVAEQA